VSVALWVGNSSFEIGAASFFNAFFSTVFARAEGESWGSRYPMLMKELYSGTLRPELVPKALLEVRALRSDLAKLPVGDLVWNHEDRSATPPWGDHIAPHIKTLADYFVTSDGKNLLDVLETVIQYVWRRTCGHCPVMWRRVSRQVRKKIETFDESGMGYWIVRATLRDGRVFSNVFINDLFQLGFPDLSPFKARDISDVEWEGYRGRQSSGAPVLISERDAT